MASINIEITATNKQVVDKVNEVLNVISKTSTSVSELERRFGSMADKVSARAVSLAESIDKENKLIEEFNQKIEEGKQKVQAQTASIQQQTAALEQQKAIQDELNRSIGGNGMINLPSLSEEAKSSLSQELMQSVTAYDKATQAVEYYSRAVENQEDKIQNIKQQLADLNEEHQLVNWDDESLAKVGQLRDELEKQQNVLGSLQGELQKWADQQENIGNNIIAKENEELQNMSASIKEGAESLKNNNKELKKEEEILDSVTKNLQKTRQARDEHQQALDREGKKIVENIKREEEANEKKQKGLGILQALLGGQDKYNKILSALPPMLRMSIQEFTGLITVARAFISTPIGAVLAALGLAFQAINKYLNGTIEGQGKLAKITGAVSGVVGTFSKYLVKVGEHLFRAVEGLSKLGIGFKDVRQPMSVVMGILGAVGKALQEILSGAINVGQTLYNVVTGNFFDAWKNAKEYMGNIKGLFNPKEYKEAYDKMANIGGKFVDDLATNVKESKAIAEEEHKLGLKRIENQTKLAELEKDIAEKRNAIYKAANKKEKAEAIRAAQELITAKYSILREEADKEAELAERKLAISPTSMQDKLGAEQKKAGAISMLAREQNEQRFLTRQLASTEKGGNSDSLKQLRAAERYRLIMEQDALQVSRREEDMIMEQDQNIINTLNDGAEKILRQRELNHRKELIQIARQAEDNKRALIEKARKEFEANPANKNKQFNADSYLNSEDYKESAAMIDKTARTAIEAAQAQYNNGVDIKNIIDQYKTVEQERLAIRKKFDDDIAVMEAQLEKTTGDEVIKNLQDRIEKAKKMREQAVEQEKKTMYDYLLDYGTYAEQVNTTKQLYANKISSTDDAYEIKRYEKEMEEALIAIDKKFGLVAGDFVDLFSDAAVKSTKRIQEIIDKYRILIDYMEGGGMTGTPVDGKKATKYTLNDITGLGFDEKEIKKLASDPEKLKEVTSQLLKLKEELSKRDMFASFIDNMDELRAKLKKGDLSIGEFVTGAISTIDQIVPKMKQFASDLANIFNFSDKGVSKAMTAADGILGTAGGVGSILAGNPQGILEVVGGISKLVTAFGGSNIDEMNRRIEDLNASNVALKSVMDDLARAFEKSSVADAGEIYEQQVKILQQQIANEQAKILAEGAKWEKGSHSIWSQLGWNENSDVLKQASEITGTTMKSVTDLVGLSADKWVELRDADTDLYNRILSAFRGAENEHTGSGLDEMVGTFVETFAGKFDDLEAQLKEKITGITFDSMFSKWKSTLSNMKSTTLDFGEDVSDILNNALTNAVTDNYKDDLEAVYKGISKAVENKDYGAFDYWKKEYVRISEMARDDLKQMESMGYISTAPYKQDYSKGVGAMTEDQADEMNGRLSAQYIVTMEIRNSVLQGFAQVSAGVGVLTEQNHILGEIQGNVAIANTHLSDIAKYTKSMIEFGDKLQRIADNTNRI